MKRGYAAIGLFNPKTNANVGGVLRAMACYEASMLAIQGTRYTRAATDTTKAYRHLPLVHGDLRSLIPFDCIPVAVDRLNSQAGGFIARPVE